MPKRIGSETCDSVDSQEITRPHRACPLCGGTPRGLGFPYRTAWNDKIFLYRRCRHCSSTFVDPVPTHDELETIYSWENYHRQHYLDESIARHEYSIAFLGRHRGHARTLLDFGCGSGTYLMAARNAGYEAEGVELAPSVIAMARERTGLPVHELRTLLSQNCRFDVIHLLDVVHHVADPESLFRSLECLLAPGGCFYIEAPLENNPSLVYCTAVWLKRLRRLARRDRVGKNPPTMLFRVDAKMQRWFFAERLSYREVCHEVYESGWPYYVEGQASARGLGPKLRQSIGHLAVRVGRTRLAQRLGLGNRFIAIYVPHQEPDLCQTVI